MEFSGPLAGSLMYGPLPVVLLALGLLAGSHLFFGPRTAEYQPHWQARYLCFASARDLHSVAVAVLRAEAFLGGGRDQRNAVAEMRIG